MKVRELIELLSPMNPEAEVHVPSALGMSFGDGLTEADEVYATTATYGILTTAPTTVPVVAIDYSVRGL